MEGDGGGFIEGGRETFVLLLSLYDDVVVRGIGAT